MAPSDGVSDKLSHAVIRRNGEIVGAAQAIIYKVPADSGGHSLYSLGAAVAEKGSRCVADTLAAVLAGLKKEYCEKRGLLLRMTPGIWEEAMAGDANGLFQDQRATSGVPMLRPIGRSCWI